MARAHASDPDGHSVIEIHLSSAVVDVVVPVSDNPHVLDMTRESAPLFVVNRGNPGPPAPLAAVAASRSAPVLDSPAGLAIRSDGTLAEAITHTPNARYHGRVASLAQNPFSSLEAARQYLSGRLAVHERFVAQIGTDLPSGRTRRALDIGCGTGLSTVPLHAIAERVIGIDSSTAMLRVAASGAVYVRGAAEALPFESSVFGLVTMACTFHWCEPEALLRETRRVLEPKGVLAVYDHHFAWKAAEAPGLPEQYEAFMKEFPRVARHSNFDTAIVPGFETVGRTRKEEQIPLNLDSLVGYLASQSNVLGAVNAQRMSMAAAHKRIRACLEPVYGGRPTLDCAFGFELDLLRLHRVPGTAG